VDDGAGRETVEAVLPQERKYLRGVEGTVEFVRRPKEWLENAEFHHLDKY
jgi:hypothetical protein